VTPAALDVEIHGAHADEEERVERAARAAARAAGAPDGHLAVAFVDEVAIRDLNRAHRSKDAPTDVLSFPVDGTGQAVGPRELGDVVVCRAHARDVEEAVVHGVLHLCGLDHEEDEGEMLALQARVLGALT
jgi:probable rRNA maturation factor